MNKAMLAASSCKGMAVDRIFLPYFGGILGISLAKSTSETHAYQQDGPKQPRP